jgi:ribosome recycling factor
MYTLYMMPYCTFHSCVKCMCCSCDIAEPESLKTSNPFFDEASQSLYNSYFLRSNIKHTNMAPRSRGLELASSILLASTRSRSHFAYAFNVQRPSRPPACVHGSRLNTAPRTFSTTPTPLKKKDKGKKASDDTPVPDNKAQRNRDAEIDPYDYSTLQAGIDKAIERLKDALSKTRNAGRVSSENIEDLRVELSKGGKKVRLGDIAAVVPKGGRTMQVFCGEDDHVRPITAAIQASPFSLTPTPDKENALLLTFPVPPATSETRQQAAEEAKRMKERADLDVRTARGDAQKLFNKWDKEKAVIKDELHKAREGMEKVVKAGSEEVKKTYEAALKTLER